MPPPEQLPSGALPPLLPLVSSSFRAAPSRASAVPPAERRLSAALPPLLPPVSCSSRCALLATAPVRFHISVRLKDPPCAVALLRGVDGEDPDSMARPLMIDASLPLPTISAQETDGFIFKFSAPSEFTLYQSSSIRVGVCHTAHTGTIGTGRIGRQGPHLGYSSPALYPRASNLRHL